jgi:hypothetical protein
MKVLEPERPAYDTYLLNEQWHRPQGWVVGMIRVARPQLVIEDDAPPGSSHRLQRFQVVMGRSGPAVQAQERQLSRRFTVSDDTIPDVVASERNEALIYWNIIHHSLLSDPLPLFILPTQRHYLEKNRK